MTIDFHTHIFPASMAEKVIVPMGRSSRARHYADGTAEGLLASMARAGVDRSVVLPVATNARQVEMLNATSAEANAKLAGRGIFSFGAMHPDYADYKAELARVKERGLKGVKIHPPYQQTPLDDPRYLRILDRCAELDLIVVTHAGIDVGVPGDWCTPEQAVRAVEQVPWPKLVLAHLGGWRQWDQVLEQLAGRDLYLDTAFCFGALEPAPGTQRTAQERAAHPPGDLCGAGAPARGGAHPLCHRQPVERPGPGPGRAGFHAPDGGGAGRHSGRKRPKAAGRDPLNGQNRRAHLSKMQAFSDKRKTGGRESWDSRPPVRFSCQVRASSSSVPASRRT